MKNKAISLKPFVDEYVSISSNYHFFRELNFSAGGFLGDTFSVYLTSGPISAIGSVLDGLCMKIYTYLEFSIIFGLLFCYFCFLLL